MNQKDVQLRNKQRERNQRGEDFQDEIRRSWRLLPSLWRTRITDGGGGTRPADELIITQDINIIAEHKRTQKKSFQLNFMRPNQITGLVDFDQIIDRNLGLVFVSFLDEAVGVDKAYAFRLITALHYMKKKGRVHITLEEFIEKRVPCVELPRLENGLYDLQGVVNCYKFL